MSLELFVLPSSGGLYPRRVLIYLSEKGLLSLPNLTITTTSGPSHSALGKLPGSVPQLRLTTPLGEVSHILESIPIINHLEDLCDVAQTTASSPFIKKNGESKEEEDDSVWRKRTRSMRGDTPGQRARTREITALADEATTHFSTACRFGSAMFALLAPRTNGDYAATQAALVACRRCLVQINAFYDDDLRFAESIGKSDGSELDGEVLVGDCLVFALLQFAICLYGVNLADGAVGERDSGVTREGGRGMEGRVAVFGGVGECAGAFSEGVVWVEVDIYTGGWKQTCDDIETVE
ncbi:hypothetical protein LTR84_005437 [Exophiala bonariae]|uniref:GST N-terminal domain-containing protein n=1 Tax=Exophiala bonariae TaxID=1690606 RepID=A0AAV9N4L5_9EURO|nr:hypothetical protein LTR84_005437 [Exophiala bonariae]